MVIRCSWNLYRSACNAPYFFRETDISKMLAHKTDAGTFIIRPDGDGYVLLHHDGSSEALLRFGKTPEELKSALLSNFSDGVKSSEVIFDGMMWDTSTLGIPSEFSRWVSGS